MMIKLIRLRYKNIIKSKVIKKTKIPTSTDILKCTLEQKHLVPCLFQHFFT